MTETVRVFVNGVGHDVTKGGSALDAVAAHSSADAGEVRAGNLLVTDSRGIAVPSDSALFNGAVFRLIPNRDRDASDPAARFES